MNKGTVLRLGVLSTLGEVESGSAASVRLFTALSSDVTYREWTELVMSMVDAGWLTDTDHVLQLTPEGRELADRVNAALAAAKAERAKRQPQPEEQG